MTGIKFFSLSADSTQVSNIAGECAALLKIDSCVGLIPTETVYGLVCRWNDQNAYEKIWKIKKRPKDKKFQMLALSVADAEKFGFVPDVRARNLLDSFSPGPLTVISRSSFGGSIGLRIPSNAFSRAVLSGIRCPLAATSANISGAKDFSGFGPILSSLAGTPDFAVDAGLVDGCPSTVVDLSGSEIRILRHGKISEKMILEAISK
ncbi:MAG TPA: Sua5/YciO/YrdC/YwlC family protein [Victivallales bacterium]|nr:Sua5/YciO/YrdC/YwlC family protein [Victivallales bacterium]